jgi:hypothetical protein
VTTISSNVTPAPPPPASIVTARHVIAVPAALLVAAALSLATARAAYATSETSRGVPTLAPTKAADGTPIIGPRSPILCGAAGIAAATLAQDEQQNEDDGGSDENANKAVSSDQIQKYIAVYRAMQRNHSMKIDQAAAAQGLSLPAFRDIERRIESDDVARDDVRRALAEQAESPTPAATPKAHR